MDLAHVAEVDAKERSEWKDRTAGSCKATGRGGGGQGRGLKNKEVSTATCTMAQYRGASGGGDKAVNTSVKRRERGRKHRGGLLPSRC